MRLSVKRTSYYWWHILPFSRTVAKQNRGGSGSSQSTGTAVSSLKAKLEEEQLAFILEVWPVSDAIKSILMCPRCCSGRNGHTCCKEVVSSAPYGAEKEWVDVSARSCHHIKWYSRTCSFLWLSRRGVEITFTIWDFLGKLFWMTRHTSHEMD